MQNFTEGPSMKRNLLVLLGLIIGFYSVVTVNSGCAQIGYPTGGVADSLAPVLVKSSPEIDKLNFTGNRITLTFDEYIEIKDIQTNLLISPLPKTNPTISSNLKTVSIKLKDTLLPNTTYSINFGNSIVDVHEGNPLKNFSYTFSTGNMIDSLELSGKVLLAESGKADSTIMLLLYRNASDSDVTFRKPDYITRSDANGLFKFKYLPAAAFNIYALKDGDGGKTYNSKTETFAFYDSEVNTAEPAKSITLFAFALEKPAPLNPVPSGQKKPAEKKLRYTNSLIAKQQDILQPLNFTFTNGIKSFDARKLTITDTSFNTIPNLTPTLDSTRQKLEVKVNWIPETEYYFILQKDALEDSAGNSLEKADTVRFTTKKLSDYGSIVLRFRNIDLSKHPVIQFLQADAVKYYYPVTGSEWSNKRFPPGEYEIRILYDDNNNGIWDPGNFKEKRQPERAVSLPQKLAIKADWENEREIQL